MRIKTHFFSYIGFLHLVILGLLFYEFQDQKLWVIGLEIVVILSLFWSFRLYRLIVKPIDLMINAVQSIKDQDFSCKFRMVGQKEVDQLIEVYNQMIDLLREEKRIQQEKHFFLEKLIAALPVGIVLVDANHLISQLNQAALTMIREDMEIVIGKNPGEIDSALCREMSRMPANTTKTIHVSGIERYNVVKGYFLDQGYKNHFFIIQEMTMEIVEIEKHAYGKVIRMMSHEVNNSIGAINSLLHSLLSLHYPLPQEEQQEFEEIMNTVIQRNENLNLFMRNFADIIRLPKPAKERYDLNNLVCSVQTLMHGFAESAMAEIRFDPSPGPFWIYLDVRQIEQLLMNLVKNSIEAGAKQIRITLDPATSALSISDDGRGFTPEEEQQLFTPFYTTKKEGQGIGLTLAREIALNHHFSFSLKNNSPKGAVFTLRMQG